MSFVAGCYPGLFQNSGTCVFARGLEGSQGEVASIELWLCKFSRSRYGTSTRRSKPADLEDKAPRLENPTLTLQSFNPETRNYTPGVHER